MIVYKIDVLEELKKSGYSTARLRKEKIIGEKLIQTIRKNEMIGMTTLDKICTLLNLQPGDIIAHVDIIKTTI